MLEAKYMRRAWNIGRGRLLACVAGGQGGGVARLDWAAGLYLPLPRPGEWRVTAAP